MTTGHVVLGRFRGQYSVEVFGINSEEEGLHTVRLFANIVKAHEWANSWGLGYHNDLTEPDDITTLERLAAYKS